MAAKNYVSRIFGHSPVHPIQQHMAKVQAAAELVVPFFEAVASRDLATMKKLQSQIAELENEADRLKKNLRLHLPKTLFMPVARADLLDLITKQDHVANAARDVCGLVMGREMQLPESTVADFKALAARAVDTCNQAAKTVAELDELFEAGFGGAEATLMESMIEELDRIESDTDDIERELRRKLFAIEKQSDPVEVMFLYKVVDALGEMANEAQRVGSRLHLLLAR